jgi:hypothetical protein
MEAPRPIPIVRVAVVLCASITLSRAQPTIDGPELVDITAGEAEGLSVDPSGHLIAVSSPVRIPGIPEEAFTSSITVLLHTPGAPVSFRELFTVDLGPGEVTDVVLAKPLGLIITNMREDALHPENKLVVIRGSSVQQTIELPLPADGLGLTKSGRFLVLAVEKGEEIRIYEVSAGGLSLAAVVDREAMLPYFEGEEGRLAVPIEPEAVAFTPDDAVALVSLQEQSSVVFVSLESIASALDAAGGDPGAPEDIGAAALVNIVHLPFGFQNSQGVPAGVEPDGLDVSPDGSYVIVANEASNQARHLAGLSIVDLRGGLDDIPEPVTLCIFDVDPTLLDGTAFTSCPLPGPGGTLPAGHNTLPRLDPNGTAIFERSGRTVCAVNIERPPRDEDRGSVLFLDVTGIVDGTFPTVITRRNVGLNRGARPEGLKTSTGDAFVWVALNSDQGSIARFEIGD